MRAGRVFVLTLIASLPAAMIQASPPPLATQIRLIDPADGFVAVGEVVTPGGAVIDTFRSGDVTVSVLGSAGSTARARRMDDRRGNSAGIGIELGVTRPKVLEDAAAYARSGRTVVGDLVALGMPEDEARAQFGDMDVANPEVAGNPRLVASLEDAAALATQLAVRTSTSIPYDTQCARVSAQNGLIEGYGCSTLYLVAASGGDWWFNNKYKFSARSKDPSQWFCIPGTCPWRLYQAGWSLGWSSGNVLYDWEPIATVRQSSCSTISFGRTFHGVSITVSGTVCPDRLQPWSMTTRRSGAEWIGIEQGTAWEATFGIQGIHSPPGAPASYSSSLSLQWARLNT